MGFFLTHMPVKEGGEPVFRNFDKVAHFGLYGGLAFLIAFWLGAKRSRQQAAFAAIFICSIYGLADEGIQYFIPSRNASLWDYLADVLGAICGSLSYLCLCLLLSKDGFKSRKTMGENRK